MGVMGFMCRRCWVECVCMQGFLARLFGAKYDLLVGLGLLLPKIKTKMKATKLIFSAVPCGD